MAGRIEATSSGHRGSHVRAGVPSRVENVLKGSHAAPLDHDVQGIVLDETLVIMHDVRMTALFADLRENTDFTQRRLALFGGQ